MGKQRDEERKFLESVDRLLAGEEIESGEDMSKDYQTAINFVQKLTEFRAEPSSEFKTNLKQRLLMELTRQEVAAQEKAKRNWFWESLGRLVPQSVVWRTATATIAVVLVTVGVIWRAGMFTPSPIMVTMEKAVEEEQVGVKDAAPEPVPAAARTLEAEAQLAMERVIEVNQVQTAGGLSITLERVELRADGIVFFAFTTPPGYKPPFERTAPALAEYTVDGMTISAGYPEIMALEKGIRMVWGHQQAYLDPIPSDATELVFTIVSFGDWQGPWEFIIALEE